VRGTALKVVRYSVLAVFLFLSAQPVRAQDEEPDSSGVRPSISGENEFVYRYRNWEGDSDSDFYDYWYLRGRDLLDGRVDAYFSGRLHKDLDGSSISLADDVFASIEDVNDDGWEDQIYQLYADIHDLGRNFGARVGRQYIDDGDWLQIDGVDLRAFEREPVSVHGFVGRPVSYYSGTSDDWAYGGSVTARPWWGNRSRLTYIRYEDDSRQENDDWYALDVWQRLTDEWRTRGRLSFVDDRFQTAAVDVTYYNLPGDLDVFLHASYWGGLGQESREYSPLFSILGELEPYFFASARFNKVLTEWLTVSPGVSGRFVEGSKRDTRNRQYGHYDLSFIFEPFQDLYLTVAGEYWDVNRGDEFWGVTGEVLYRPDAPWEAAVGTGYIDYTYQRFNGGNDPLGDLTISDDGVVTEISPDAYSVYGRCKVDFTRHLWGSIRGEIEDNSLESDLAYALRTSVAVRF
jgi:hypothetical protein